MDYHSNQPVHLTLYRTPVNKVKKFTSKESSMKSTFSPWFDSPCKAACQAFPQIQTWKSTFGYHNLFSAAGRPLIVEVF